MKTLRTYQAEAVKAAEEALAGEEKRALIVLATGLGKTVVASEFGRRWLMDEGRLLFLAHTTDILRQARKEFAEALGGMEETGIITSNEVENIDAPALFVTFQSMLNMMDMLKPDAFAYIIVDEAHHGHATEYKKVIDYFTPDFLLGMTATPDRADGLDIRDIFGEPVYDFPLARAIAEGWLAEVDYKVMTDNISLAKLRELVRDATSGKRKVTWKQLDDTLFIEERLDEIARLINAEKTNGQKTIIFCNSIAHLRAISVYLPDAAPYHSELPHKQLEKTLKEFRSGKIKTIIVIDKFNEGMDIPDAELLVFLRSTESRTIWFQQLGRGTRKTPLKHRVKVLDFVANCDRLADIHKFERDIAGGGGGSKPGRLSIHVDNWTFTFAEELRDLLVVLDRLNVDFYDTIEEAKAAVQLLKPVPGVQPQYRATYMQDPRLPSAPEVHYRGRGWISWSDYLGKPSKEKYSTIQEAKAAVQRLGSVPTSQPTYRKICHQDPRLPSAPDVYYRDNGWEDWPDFLGKSPYETIIEAMMAVQRLVPIPTTSEAYKATFKQDPRLRSDPSACYRDRGWKCWSDFLGTSDYESYEEAKMAIRSLSPVPKTEAEYSLVYKQDKHLPSVPSRVYAGRGWTSWHDFLGKPRSKKS